MENIFNQVRNLSLIDKPQTWTAEELFLLSLMYKKGTNGYSGLIEQKTEYSLYILFGTIIVASTFNNLIYFQFSLVFFFYFLV